MQSFWSPFTFLVQRLVKIIDIMIKPLCKTVIISSHSLYGWVRVSLSIFDREKWEIDREKRDWQRKLGFDRENWDWQRKLGLTEKNGIDREKWDWQRKKGKSQFSLSTLGFIAIKYEVDGPFKSRRSCNKLDGHLSQSGRSSTIVDGLLSQSGRSWVEVDGHSAESGRSGWIEG